MVSLLFWAVHPYILAGRPHFPIESHTCESVSRGNLMRSIILWFFPNLSNTPCMSKAYVLFCSPDPKRAWALNWRPAARTSRNCDTQCNMGSDSVHIWFIWYTTHLSELFSIYSIFFQPIVSSADRNWSELPNWAAPWSLLELGA